MNSDYKNLGQYNFKVLIAEDNYLNYVVTSQRLFKWRIKTDHANNGEEVMDMVNKNNYDLILMDLQMPVMDGYHATQDIRKQNNIIPIVALTANVDENVQKKVKAVGMNDVIRKPTSPDDLYRIVTKHLDINFGNENSDASQIDKNEEENIEKLSLIIEKVSMGDNDFARELIQLYIKSIDEYETLISKAISDKDHQLAENVIHKVKTTFITLNLQNLQNTSNEILNAIKSEYNDDGQLSKKTKDQCDSIKRRLQKLL